MIKPSPTISVPVGYMPQLDSLRAFAVLAVMFAHFGGPFSAGIAKFGVDVGALGVRLFFVLSGFLITGILMKSRSNADGLRIDDGIRAMRRFYIRRILRIFPLYYLVLVVAWVLGLQEVRTNFISHLLYISDFSGITMGSVSHLWSLCVEEQFYIVWPFIVLFMHRRYLVIILLGVILICSSISLVLSNELIERTVFSFAFLAIGCLLSLRMDLTRGYRYSLPVLLASWPLCVWGTETIRNLAQIVFGLGQGFVFAWVIGVIAIGFQERWWGRVLNATPLHYLGRISYGLYVYHLFMPVVVRYGLVKIEYDIHPLARSGLYIVATFAIAALSWHLFEKPFCVLKSRFQ